MLNFYRNYFKMKDISKMDGQKWMIILSVCINLPHASLECPTHKNIFNTFHWLNLYNIALNTNMKSSLKMLSVNGAIFQIHHVNWATILFLLHCCSTYSKFVSYYSIMTTLPLNVTFFNVKYNVVASSPIQATRVLNQFEI